MSKEKKSNNKDTKKKGKKGNDNKNNKNNNRKFQVPENVKKLSKITLKKFKKENDYYDSKKQLKKGYYDYLMEMLPDGIKFIIRYGHMESNKEIKEAIYEKICDPAFVKHLTKRLKDGDVDDFELLPNIIYDIIKEASKQTKASTEAKADENGEKKEEPKVEDEFDLADLTKLSKVILKKKIKKLVKAGVNEEIAFDVLSAIPSSKIIEKSPYHHIRNLFVVLYHHGKDKDINLDVIMKKVFSDDDMRYVISFSMLEKKSKLTTLTDKQKVLFADVTKFTFKRLEKYDKDDITEIIKTYIKCRKNDEQRNMDSERRLALSALPVESYPKINKALNKLIKADESIKKYL